MALVTTPGSTASDSYATLAAADAYHLARGNVAWTGTDELKEGALRRGTTWLDAVYRSRWPGWRLNARDQSLDWPRSGVTDAEGTSVDNDTIPIEIINATIEAALRELVTPGSLTPDYLAAGQLKSLEVVGVVKREFFADPGQGGSLPVLNIVDGILASLIGTRSRNVIQLIRA